MALGEAGQSVLWLALALAAYGAVLAVAAGARAGARLSAPLLEHARRAAAGTAALAVLAAGLLVCGFVGHDFSLRYVAQNATRDAPLAVNLTGFWGGQAGSLLFWATGLALLTGWVAWVELERHRPLMPGVLGTLLGIQVFFFVLLAAVASPFETLPEPAPDGRGLNPLLWDDGMRIHPPLLLTGYMSFSVPFAFAVGALASGRVGADWLAAVRRWMLLAWAIQGAGLLAGAWWAYHVLGWGGYWGWDPVENVALLPWLTATAFLHSAMVQERRGMLKVWNVSLVLASFCLAVFGTFVVRSGIIASVHSFAQSAIGPYFLAFLGLVLAGSLGLLFARLPLLRAETQFHAVLSREAGFLVNNLLLVGIAAATFWGTVFPLVAELASGTRVTVGAPFFREVNGPLLLALLALMGAGPLLAWRRTAPSRLWRDARWPLLVALLVGVALFAAGARRGLALLALAAAAFTAAATVGELWRGLRLQGRRRAGDPWPVALLALVAGNRRRYGGYLVHLAMVCIAGGVIASSFYQTEEVATVGPGQTLSVGRYRLTSEGLGERVEPGLLAVYARLTLGEGQRVLGQPRPERRVHRNWEQQPVSVVALSTVGPWLDDVYVLLAGWDESGAVTLRVFVNPLVSLIWLGGGVFLLGTVIAGWPEPVRPRPAGAERPLRREPREVAPSAA
jgi:cytochrome c-type biogenesis protein CcmF